MPSSSISDVAGCINYDIRVAADEIQVSVAVCKKLRDNVVRIEKNCPDCISRAHYSALRSYAEDKQNTQRRRRNCSRTPKIRQLAHRIYIYTSLSEYSARDHAFCASWRVIKFLTAVYTLPFWTHT